MALEINGGVPAVRKFTATTTVADFKVPNAPTKYLQVNNEGSDDVRMYFTAADAAADDNYIILGANASGFEFFEGPVELADNESRIWFLADSGSQELTIVSYQRRG